MQQVYNVVHHDYRLALPPQRGDLSELFQIGFEFYNGANLCCSFEVITVLLKCHGEAMEILEELLGFDIAEVSVGLPVSVLSKLLCLNRSKGYLSLVSGWIIIIGIIFKLRTTRAKKLKLPCLRVAQNCLVRYNNSAMSTYWRLLIGCLKKKLH